MCIPNNNFTVRVGSLGYELHFCCNTYPARWWLSGRESISSLIPRLPPQLLCTSCTFMWLFSYCQVGTGSQALLDNAERYGLYLASVINDSSTEMILSRPNIGEYCIIVNLYESMFFLCLYMHVMCLVFACLTTRLKYDHRSSHDSGNVVRTVGKYPHK